MKYKIALLIGFVLIACFFALFAKRKTYYSNSGEKIITEKFFDFYCALRQAGDQPKLEIKFDFHGVVDHQRLLQLAVTPISNNRDTLKLIDEYANNQYTFQFPTHESEKLDLIINYKVDSAGFQMNKSIKYYNLEKTYAYYLSSPF